MGTQMGARKGAESWLSHPSCAACRLPPVLPSPCPPARPPIVFSYMLVYKKKASEHGFRDVGGGACPSCGLGRGKDACGRCSYM